MSTNLKIGDKAPIFEAQDQNGNTIQLKDFSGKKVALYFYPKDNTPGCTAEACSIRDNYTVLKQKGVVILGVSTDAVSSHKKFEEKHQLPFTLIADPEKKIVELYGVYGLKKFMGKEHMGTFRTTFLINEEGIIEHIIDKVKTKESAEQILEVWGL